MSYDKAFYLANQIDIQLPERYSRHHFERILESCVKEALNVSILLDIRNENSHDILRLRRALHGVSLKCKVTLKVIDASSCSNLLRWIK